MSKLSITEVKAAMPNLPEWKRRQQVLHREYKFADFVTAMKFVNTVAKAAEAANHHPDIDIRWNKVRLTLTTHDAGGLTKKDFTLAERCDVLGKKGAATAAR